MNEAAVVLIGTASLSAPLVLAAMGGLLSERSGVIHIGLEGKMLAGSVFAALTSLATGNPWAGLAGGVCGAVLLAFLHFWMTQSFRIDHIISGMAINALAFGASNLIDRQLIQPLSARRMPHLPEWFYMAMAVAAPILIYAYVALTRGGLRLRAVGEDPDKSRQMGISPWEVRFQALGVAGVLCGLAGALLVSSAGSFVDQMTAGRGFIALAALILGGWRALPALAACIVFGFFDALQIQLQGTELAGARLPAEFWKMLPYLATLVAMMGFLGRNRAPAGLGRP